MKKQIISNYKSLLMEKRAFRLEDRHYLFDKWRHYDVEADAKRIALFVTAHPYKKSVEAISDFIRMASRGDGYRVSYFDKKLCLYAFDGCCGGDYYWILDPDGTVSFSADIGEE